MSNTTEVYINSLLADATYALDGETLNGITGLALKLKLNDRMTPALAKYISDNFTVVTHVESSDIYNSGFDATVWRDNSSSKIYVSMQGTTGLTDFTADVDLTVFGLAREQVQDMVNWWLKNTTPVDESAQQIGLVGGVFVWALPTDGTGILSDISNVVVNGHSLGGHLATAFSRLFGGEWPVDHTYSYNSAGFTAASEVYFRNIESILDAGTGIGRFPSSGEQSNFFAENGINVTTQNLFNGQKGQRIALFNEESTNPIANHFIYKLTDALALGDVLASLDSSYDISSINALFETSSNKTDASLERTLDDFRKLFVGDSITATPVSDDSGSSSRTTYHENLFALKVLLFNDPDALQLIAKSAYQNLQLVSVDSLASAFTADTPEGLAYRYALLNLNPFAVVGLDQATSDTLYKTAHNPNGELNWYNPATGQGTLTTAYLKDRAEMLQELLQDNASDSDYSDAITWSDRYYQDVAGTPSDRSIGATDAGKYILFADDNGQALAGSAGFDPMTGSGNDRLYGGAGNDTLEGKQGSDYLEGGKGNDKYIYTSGDFTTGDGWDTILDVDGAGSIEWNGGVLGRNFYTVRGLINTACLQNHNSVSLLDRKAA